MTSPLSKFGQKPLRGYEERILVQDSADDHEWMRPHDVDDSVPGKPAQMICANDGIVVTPPDIVDAGLEFDQVFEVLVTVRRPIHPAHDATHRELAFGLVAGQFFENRQHPVRVETAVSEVSIRVCAKLELTCLLSIRTVDPYCGEALKMFSALVRIHDMNRFVAAFKPVLDEGEQYAVFLFITAK